MPEVKTYSPKDVIMAFGSHAVSGYADDSFISIEESGEGTQKQVGCDGEVVRSVNPNRTYTLKVVVLQSSPTNGYLQNQYGMDGSNGDGYFPITVKDLKGGLLFSADTGWVQKAASRGYGLKANNREWTIDTGLATLTE